MKKMDYTVFSTLTIALMTLLPLGTLQAGSFEGYLVDSMGAVVRTPFGECIHTGFWEKSYAQPECDDILEIRSKYAVAVDTAEKAGEPIPEKPAEIVEIEAARIEEIKPTASVEVGLPQSTDVASEQQRDAEPAPEPTEVEVMDGGNLWTIASSDQVYGNAALWPLLLCANKDQIVDADLIYAGQILSVPHDASDEMQQAAIDHANNRGDWELGEVEDSDLEYLALNCN